MTATQVRLQEAPWTGTREVLSISGPLILGMLSYTIMEFVDKVMCSYLGTDALAAVGSAGIASFTLCTLFMGIASIVTTFVAQCYGREEYELCARYCWQGMYISILGIVFAIILWPLAPALFGSMGHNEVVTRYELEYFRVRVLGYFFVGATTALAGFFQSVSKPRIPMYAAIIANTTNILFNYVLIFGKFGFPRMEVAGAAAATVLSTVLQCIVMLWCFLHPHFDRSYQTRSSWAFDWKRLREMITIGMPAAISMFLDVANWWIFTSFIIGRFGAVQLAANTIAVSFMHIGFLPAVGLNHGVATIVGQWLGRRDIARAKARTYTAIRIAGVYMVIMGLTFALFGNILISVIFRAEMDVVRLGHKLLILAALFQAFDAVNIICVGALKGAGDTRWMMYITFIMSYLVFLPLALIFAFYFQWGAFGAWMGATIFIILLSGVLFRRFQGEGWRHINIFTHTSPESVSLAGSTEPGCAQE
ncbi:MAG: MATE family efflux transporter [Candidatus Hydrogenedens sp.]|nr:MATE family efflux transporter [Candidatus Hydrogenedens sp.]